MATRFIRITTWKKLWSVEERSIKQVEIQILKIGVCHSVYKLLSDQSFTEDALARNAGGDGFAPQLRRVGDISEIQFSNRRILQHGGT